MIDIQRAIQYMEETQGLVLPYGLLPGTYPGGIYSMFDEETWALYDWGALPEGIDGLDPGDMSAKPSWNDIVSAYEYSMQDDLRRENIKKLNAKARRSINLAYAAKNDIDEIFLRLSNEHNEANDEERRRLLQVCRTQKRAIIGMALDDLMNYDALADVIWARPPFAASFFTAIAGNERISLSAQCSHDGQSDITKWQYRQALSEVDLVDASWTDISESASNFMMSIIAGLSNGTVYYFNVRAVNAVGDGDLSEIRSATPTV